MNGEWNGRIVRRPVVYEAGSRDEAGEHFGPADQRFIVESATHRNPLFDISRDEV